MDATDVRREPPGLVRLEIVEVSERLHVLAAAERIVHEAPGQDSAIRAALNIGKTVASCAPFTAIFGAKRLRTMHRGTKGMRRL